MKAFIYSVSLMCMFLLASCSRHSDGSSVWGGGLWLVALLPAASGIYSYIRWKHFRDQWAAAGKPSGEYPMGHLIFTVCFFLATVVIILMVNAER